MDDTTKALGNDVIAYIAKKPGISGSNVSSGLAALLPKIIKDLKLVI